MDVHPLIQLGVALGIGLLVGLQRERTESSVAGIRTFPLIAMFGTMCAWIATWHGAWILAAGLVALAALLVFGNLARLKAGEIDPGLTTEVAALLLYGVGAYVVVGQMTVAVALGGIIALLLQFKKPMHEFVAAIGEADIKAMMQFVLVTLVVLPILPNQAYGPYQVLNPFKIWLMVVLVVGMSLIGYVLYKFYGQRTGAVLNGLLGGLISSTAVTLSSARQTGDSASSAAAGAQVIVLASATMFLRMLVAIAIVASGSFLSLAGPLATMLGITTLIAVVGFLIERPRSKTLASQRNPAQLPSALVFGALYAVVIFAVAAAKQHFGTSGFYVVAGVSGLEGVDAIAVSSGQLVAANQLEAAVGWRGMLIAALVNLLVKAGLVAVLGSKPLLSRIVVPFILMLVAGVAILWLWPG